MQKDHVRFTSNIERESEIPKKAMSALPPKADMCVALAYVRFGPTADIPRKYGRLSLISWVNDAGCKIFPVGLRSR
jgi:hypothetical protein